MEGIAEIEGVASALFASSFTLAYEKTVNEDYVIENTVNTVFVNNDSEEEIEITLPSTPVRYTELWVKDIAGNAGTYNITITGSIDGEASYIIGSNYGGALLRWSGSEWSLKA